MAVRIKLKRGLEEDVKLIVLEEGELAYSTDTYKIFVGDGTTAGGHLVGANSLWEEDGSGDLEPI